MIKCFITVKNNVITGYHGGDSSTFAPDSPYFGHEIMTVPDNRDIRTGDTVDMYLDGWQRKSFEQLMGEGLAVLPEGWKVGDDGKPQEMTDEEKIIAGLKEPQAGNKVVDDQIISMTQEEQYEAGQITKEDFETYKSQQNQTELSRRLTELNTPENQAQAIIDDEFAASWKARITALLAVKQQSGWPLSVIWPE